MAKYIFRCIFSLLFIKILLAKGFYIPIENNNYSLMDYLVISGQYCPKYVLRQPYIMTENDSFISHYLASEWLSTFKKGNTLAQLEMTGGLDVLHSPNDYGGQGSIQYQSDHVLFASQVDMLSCYKRDSYFAGDLSESDHWVWGRFNEAYMAIQYDHFDFFMGKMKINWGVPNDYSLVLSSYPYTYNQVQFAYKDEKFQLTVLLAPLEEMDGYEFDSSDSTVISLSESSKFVSGHRLDLAFSEKFQIAITEMAIYGGPNRDFELAYINPVDFYYGIQRNDSKGMSGLWTVDFYYRLFTKTSVYAQLLIDDFIINNDPGVDDRAQYPDRIGYKLDIHSADILINGLNIQAGFTHISNRTYQSLRNWENYHYRGLSLGYPAAGCDEIKLKVSYWGLNRWMLEGKITAGRFGNVSVEDMFCLEKEEFPKNPVTNNLFINLKSIYYLRKNIKLSIEYAFLKDLDYYENRMQFYNGHSLSIGASVIMRRSMNF